MRPESVTLFLAGDVMTGRGIDQALPHPGSPTLHEPDIHDARRYLALAEAAAGPIQRPLLATELWRDALPLLGAAAPATRIVNLETSITTSEDWCHEKDVHYRMHPDNVGCLAPAMIDVASVANNHTLDWGRRGLLDTLAALRTAGIQPIGGGETLAVAREPAVVPLAGAARLIVAGVGSCTSGIPPDWQATERAAGLDLVDLFSVADADQLAVRVAAKKGVGDIGMVSIHWGSNWGFEVPDAFRRFAHRLVDGGIDVVHGHSSHHVRPLEIYRERPIVYGCGDLIDDYEGISGHERFRGDLGLLFFLTLDAADGRLRGLRMAPTRMRRFSLRRADPDDAAWLAATLDRTSRPFGCAVGMDGDGMLVAGPTG